MLKGEECSPLLIRQQLISSQPGTHMRSNRPQSHEHMCLCVVFGAHEPSQNDNSSNPSAINHSAVLPAT